MKHLSLTARMSLMFMLAVTAVLTVAGLSFNHLSQRHFKSLDYQVLVEKLESTQSILQRLPSVTNMAGLKPQFEKRNCKVIGLSVDPVDDHVKWSKDIEETQGHAVNYPIIGDADLNVAKLYDMIHPNAVPGKRTATDNATVRVVFVIGPDKKVKAMLAYPMSTGRNFDEVLRLVDSCQLTAKHTVATPVNWKPGQDVIIPTSVSDDDAKKKYPQGFKTLKPYLRTVAQPN